MKHYLQFSDLGAGDYAYLFERAALIKKKFKAYEKHHTLVDRTMAMIFEKASTRTRVSFEAAIARLGGNAIFLRGKDVGLGTRESVVDFARVLGQYVDGLAVRTFSHSTIEELAGASSIPIINALSDESHPCQAMADFMTIEELKGSPRNQKLVFVGDGNNVARSLAVASALLGAEFLLCAPPGYEFPESFRSRFAARIAGLNMVTGTWRDDTVLDADGVAIRGLVAEDGPAPGAPAVAVFRPSAVSVFREAPGGSPRNSLAVTITDLEPHGDQVRVRAGHLAADVTVPSVAELDLAPGVRVVFAVKANEVSVYRT